MHYLLSFLILLLCNLYSLPSVFLKNNASFLNSKIKKIKCDYRINNANHINIGSASLIMDDNHYRLSLDNKIIISDTKVMQTYFKSTNQIFIENALVEIDTLILNFFNYLNKDSQNIFFIKDSSESFIELYDGNGATIKVFTDSYSIDSLYMSVDDFREFNASLYSIELLSLPYNINDTLFTFNKPNAFILDLRD